MLQRLSIDMLNWILIIGVILFIVEMAFFHGGMLVPAIFCAFLIYIGWKRFNRLWGKVIFWFGAISLFFSVINLLAIRFLIVAGIIIFLIDYMKRKNEAVVIKPSPTSKEDDAESLIQIEPLFKTQLYGEQKTPDTAYKWRDINIHSAFGDQIIDLSNTFLPEETAVISIRHLVGNIEIYVPYEVEVAIHHSSVFGRVHIFDHHHWKLMNQTISYETEGYKSTYPRIKIITSVISGDIEVKRI